MAAKNALARYYYDALILPLLFMERIGSGYDHMMILHTSMIVRLFAR